MQIYCDFDGTITTRDTIVFLTEKFGGGVEFREGILSAIEAGEVSVYEAIERELRSVSATWEEAVEALDREISMDPGFPDFVEWCHRTDIPLKVVSSGMEPVLELFLADLRLEYFAHSVEPATSGWVYRRDPDRDKSKIIQEAEEQPVIFIGDGTSDVAVIPYVDVIFARRGLYLENYCRRHSIPCTPFGDFHEIRKVLEGDPVAQGTD